MREEARVREAVNQLREEASAREAVNELAQQLSDVESKERGERESDSALRYTLYLLFISRTTE